MPLPPLAGASPLPADSRPEVRCDTPSGLTERRLSMSWLSVGVCRPPLLALMRRADVTGDPASMSPAHAACTDDPAALQDCTAWRCKR